MVTNFPAQWTCENYLDCLTNYICINFNQTNKCCSVSPLRYCHFCILSFVFDYVYRVLALRWPIFIFLKWTNFHDSIARRRAHFFSPFDVIKAHKFHGLRHARNSENCADNEYIMLNFTARHLSFFRFVHCPPALSRTLQLQAKIIMMEEMRQRAWPD